MKSWTQSSLDSAGPPPPDYVILNAPAGAEGDLVSHGDEGWMVDPMTMTVAVPPYAVGPLIHNGGFWMARSARGAIPAGMTQIFHPEGPRTFGWRGISYAPDADGAMTVPVGAVPEAVGTFGFVAGTPLVSAAAEAAQLDPRDAEIAGLKEENARLAAENAALKTPAPAPQPAPAPAPTPAAAPAPTVTLAQVGIDTAGAATLADAGIAKPA